MDELRSILGAWRESGGALPGAVLATVVHVKGSAYRRPGARMLICGDGRRIGTISGGCLEGDVARKAAWWTAQEGVAVRTFDTSSEAAAWDFGLGCNGIITVLLEQINQGSVPELFEVLARWTEAGSEGVIATVIRASSRSGIRPGDRLVWEAQGAVGGGLRGTGLEASLRSCVECALRRRTSCLVHLPEADVFVEWIGPAQRLLVFGAGHDVIPLASMAHLLGWRLTVADSRQAYVRPDRFPGAERVVLIPSSGDISAVAIDEETAVVVMTHNFPQDKILLPQILARRPRYLGLLGPRTRTEKLFGEIGVCLPKNAPYAPVGLDLGGDRPETIALSIIAEIQAVLSNRCGGSLRDREGPIHGPPAELGGSLLRVGLSEERELLTFCETAVPA